MLLNKSFFLSLWLASNLMAYASLADNARDSANDSEVSNVNAKKGRLDTHRFSILDFELNKSTLDDVKKRFKESKIARNDSFSYICLYGKDGTTVEFSSSIMATQSHGIVGISIYSDKKLLEKSQCSFSNLISKKIESKNGIKLGLSSEKLIMRIGVPSFRKDNSVFYTYNMIINESNVEADLISGAEFLFDSNKVIQIKTYAIESL